MNDDPDRDGARAGGDVGRREVLAAAGAASAPALAGCGELLDPDGESNDRRSNRDGRGRGSRGAPGARDSSTLAIDPELDLGGRLVVGGPDALGYDTIGGAFAAAEDGDVVFVHGAYDAEDAGEDFPIVLDYTEKQVVLSGGHPSGSEIDARHTDENVVEVVGRGHADYRNNALVQHLKIVGGATGLRIQAAPYSSYKDIVLHGCRDDGVRVERYTDPDGNRKNSFGITFRNLMAWRCGGAGFRLEQYAAPHSTTFYGCEALFNGLETGAPGVQLRGTSTRWMNGTIQNNGGFGVDARAGTSQMLNGVYFEGNGMAQDRPHGVFVDEDSGGFVLTGSYFNGAYYREPPNGLHQADRAIVVVGAPGVELARCTYRNYSDAFLHVRETRDADVHVPSHTAFDGTEFHDSEDNERLRSDGTILPTDVRRGSVEGRFEGDVAIHDGSGAAPFGHALWNGRNWISGVTGAAIR